MNFSPVGMKCCPALYQFISTFINRQYSISRDLFKREHNHALSMRMQLGIQVCVQLNGSGWAIDRAHMAVLLCFQVWLPCSCNNIPTTTCTVCTQSKKFATKLDAPFLLRFPSCCHVYPFSPLYYVVFPRLISPPPV